MENASNLETINFRLGNIEKSIEKLTDITANISLQQAHIEELNAKIDSHAERSEQLIHNFEDRINAISTRVGHLEDVSIAYDAKLHNLEEAPLKAGSEKWRYIVDYVFKAVIAAAIGGLLFMTGIKG